MPRLERLVPNMDRRSMCIHYNEQCYKSLSTDRLTKKNVSKLDSPNKLGMGKWPDQDAKKRRSSSITRHILQSGEWAVRVRGPTVTVVEIVSY
ncbi:uncharacterized protein SPSK_10140 [Sporothrix schenckii 1099-18]|uniref:Uncharacterized protein n=1 Tax=Sporothrix schenckii 1099-18 TaxID=1397361 RepID=A0A0F2M9C0_SPOSC|nr:uncharacterized protein SPSK_10140 [Sporothrix schenckii 1099-18]KJR84756.1 hypothetical protein SPSK_10140 [Sporothrix schenckii 1099-18]